MVSTFVQQPMSSRFRGTLRLLTVGLVSGWLGLVGLPVASTFSWPLVTQAAIAQSSISNEEISQYARAVLQIDQYRSEAYTEIKDILLNFDMDVSEISVTCTNTQNIASVPRSVRRQVRDILTDYCNQSQDAVEAAGLSPRRFNEITEAHEADQAVFERIQQELIRLQREE